MFYEVKVEPWSRRSLGPNDRAPTVVVALNQLYQAFKLPVTLGGIDLGEKRQDLDLAGELARFFRYFIVLENLAGGGVNFTVREDGGRQFLSSAARALLWECWCGREANGKRTGLRQFKGPGDIEDILAVEDWYNGMVPITRDEMQTRLAEPKGEA